MEKRCSLALFCFALFIADDPAFAAQSEAVAEKGKPLIKKSSASRPAQQYPWKTSIVTTIFWIGERPSGNNLVPNRTSAWDKRWTKNYGGFDDPNPARRRNYIPVKYRGKTHFTAPCLTTTKPVQATGRKRPALFRGSKRRTRARLFPLAKIDGSRSAKAIELLMRNGEAQCQSEQPLAICVWQ